MSSNPNVSQPADAAHSRRSFLGQSAAMLGAAGVLGAMTSARPAQGRLIAPAGKAAARVPIAPDGPVRIGVIGTGGMGRGHIDAYINAIHKAGKEKVHIVAVCDVNDFFLADAKAKCDAQDGVKAEAYKYYRKLIARDDIHGVLIASPEHWHAQQAIDALMAGKDVYLEKPMTLRLDEAVALRQVVKANPDMIMQVGTQYAAQPKYREAKKVIESGALGPALWSQCSYCRNTPDGEWNYYQVDDRWKPGENIDWDAWCGPAGKHEWDPKLYIRWRRFRKFSTGIVGDLLVHEMTPYFVALNSSGWPVRVSAMGSHMIDKSMENHDQVLLQVQFEDGHIMTVAGNTNNENGFEKLIRCQKGNIYLNSRHCVIRPERPFTSEVDDQTIQCPDVGNDQDQHRINWIKCMRTRTQPDSDVDQGAKVMVVVDLATRAMWEGGSWTFNPKTMEMKRG
ncbi:MAG: Gfo/Idh/MocA family oxidoreductase [Planctomycetota bacterium]|nr:Gfo/Idh/MocA family oxidoreductase [Planctomycetota bacterium]